MTIKMRTKTVLKMKTSVMNSDISIGAGCSPLVIAKQCIESTGFYMSSEEIRATLEPSLKRVEALEAKRKAKSKQID